MLRRIGTELPQCCYVAGFHGSEARRRLIFQQAQQESNLQPTVLEPTPSNAGVAPFVDFQRLSLVPPTPALLDNAGVGTNPGTEEESSPAYSPAARASVSTTAMFGNSASGTPCRSLRYAGLL